MKLAWYIKRVQVMGFREALHRVYEQGILVWLRISQGRRDNSVFDSQQFQFCAGVASQLPELKWDMVANRSGAESVLDGRWPALGFAWRWQQAGDWHKAPDSGKQWPVNFFAAIPYRQGNPFGDIRVAWEPSRLQQLVSLALLAREDSSRVAAVTLFEQQLLSWVEANPPYLGIHYVSAMECGLRLIAVCHAVDIIRPHLVNPKAIWSAVVALVESHAALVVRRLSLYSSAGNHTLAETAGLIYAGLLFPELKGASQWRKTGIALFEQEASRQFYVDGGGIEQAFGYHLFITDLANLVARLLSSKKQPSTILPQIVDKACMFLAELFSQNFKLPCVGDNDGGYALSPYLRISQQSAPPGSGIKTFPDSGYSIIRESSAPGRMILFDHGPLGMAPSFGHGHSDCLSVYWREQGEALLIDAGTFTYTGEQRWRQYFRGVSAHNTVSINGRDQARQQSAFMWSEAFQPILVDVPDIIDEYSVLLAGHTGYEHLGVRHYRALVLHSKGPALIWDTLVKIGSVRESVDASLWWHLGGEISYVDDSPYVFRVVGHQGACLQIEVQGGEIKIHYGDAERPSGWYSPNYGEKVPIYSLEANHQGNFPHEFYTYITPGSANISDQMKAEFEVIIEKLRKLVL